MVATVLVYPLKSVRHLLFLAVCTALYGDPLTDWSREIEDTAQARIIVIRTRGGVVPANAPYRAIVQRYTDQLQSAEALSVAYNGLEGRLNFIVLNLDQLPDPDSEKATLAHELGHLWLRAQRYPAPAYTGGEAACLAVHAGDAVQHILIRAEADRRGILWRQAWIATLDRALDHLENEPAPDSSVGRCQTLAQVSLWADVALGLRDNEWQRRPQFFAAMARKFPGIVPAASETVEYLQRHPVAGKQVHAAALRHVYLTFQKLASSIPSKSP